MTTPSGEPKYPIPIRYPSCVNTQNVLVSTKTRYHRLHYNVKRGKSRVRHLYFFVYFSDSVNFKKNLNFFFYISLSKQKVLVIVIL